MNDPFHTLELDEILSRTAAYASSEKGKTRILSLRPSGDADEVIRRLSLTSQALKLLTDYRYSGIENFADTDEITEQLRTGAVLSM